MNSRRLFRLGLVFLIAAATMLIVLGLFVYTYGQIDRATPADVIVILGAGARPDGRPTFAYMRRIRHGVSLYQQGLAPYILCTGGFTANFPKSEARACADAIAGMGVPADAVLMEDVSRSTEENAIQARHVMTARGLRSAIVVSDNFHLFRAEWIFRDQGITVVLSPAQATVGPLYWRTAVSNTAREIAALGWYALKSALGLPQTNL